MPFWSRIANVLRGERLNREVDEELQSHIQEAIEQGREPAEARRAFGSPLRRREESRDIRLVASLDSLRADAVFGCRQLKKSKATSAAAILSLALGIGACTSAFRLIDAVLLRPLPVTHPEQLYSLVRQGLNMNGKFETFDGWAYPSFQRMRAAVAGQAELFAISYTLRVDLTYKSDQEMEKASMQYVSGRIFDSLGLRPALGRLLNEGDDLTQGAHPYAVITHDYWARRFGLDPGVIGRGFRVGDDSFQIVGVVDRPFTGTEPGTVIDIFVPAMMSPKVIRADQTWIRMLARLRPGVAVEPLRAKLNATSRAFEEERARGFSGMPKRSRDSLLNQTLVMEPAAAGVSALQSDYRRSLLAIGALVALVLLIACANVANLMTAQGAARAREMALRVSIGAGRWRLAQLVLVESAILAGASAALGGLFAWWAAPFVVSRIGSARNPVRLSLPADWRVLGFGLALTFAVTILFGLVPALRASAIRPARALKGGEDRHSRRRLMHVLIAAQVAFCFVVLFVAGLFATTFVRLSNRPMGFSAERVLYLDVIPARPQPPVAWRQVIEHLRAVPGVEKAALAGWPVLSPNSMNNFVSVHGAPPGPVLAYYLNVSPGWVDTMKIAFIAGRDFRATDTSPGVAIVNETFAKTFFHDENPIGKSFERVRGRFYEIVGVVHDAPYRSLRDPIFPIAYVPFQAVDASGAPQSIAYGAIIVRTSSSNPLALASILREEVPHARSEFRVSSMGTQEELNRGQTIREGLLAMLALFFAGVALLLAGIGLYGVLDYGVLQRRREIGIRVAIGAQAGDIARRVTLEVFAMVLVGAIAGLAAGMLTVRYLESLFYQVKPTDPALLAVPLGMILAAALLAAAPAVVRAVRIDPVAMLRAE